MRKTVFGCLGAAAIAFAMHFTPANVRAASLFSDCDPCDEVACFDESMVCDPCDPILDDLSCDPSCTTKAGQWFLNGHMEAGFFANAHGSTSTYGEADGASFFPGRGADAASGNTDLLMNTRLTGAQINQVYISAGKAVNGKYGWDIGGTFDVTWGSDAWVPQARGMEYQGANSGRWGSGDYNTAIAQAYVELAYKRWNFYVGKFYAPFGTSSYKSTDNFFYSWAGTAYIVPHIGGGAYASYKVNNKLSVFGGWIMPDEIGESSDNNAVIGGFNWTPSKKMEVRYTFAAGDNKYAGNVYDGTKNEMFVHTLLTTSQLSKRWRTTGEWSLLNSKLDNTAVAYGFNRELIYQANNRWAFGLRFGSVRLNATAAELYATNLGLDLAPGTWNNVSIGANWTPNKWLVVKPEVRYDWMKHPQQIFHTLGTATASAYQLSGGMSAVVKF